MTSKPDEFREKLRDLLIKFECDEGYYEFTDGGVWFTDKGLDEILELIHQKMLGEKK